MFEHWVKTDLKEPLRVQQLPGVLFSGDDNANKLGVIVTDGGSAVTLSGTVQAKVITPSGQTVQVNGDKSGNRAWVILPDDVYIEGHIGIYIKLLNNGEITTIGGIEAYVHRGG